MKQYEIIFSIDIIPIIIGICGLGECLAGHEEIECKCKIGTLGKRCERIVEIVEPYFAGKSYLAYPAPTSQQKYLKQIKQHSSLNIN